MSALMWAAAGQFGALASLPWNIAIAAVTARRLHDLNVPGWFQLLPAGFIFLTFVAMNELGAPLEKGSKSDAANLVMTANVLIGLGFLVWLGLYPGSRGPNSFGEANPAMALNPSTA